MKTQMQAAFDPNSSAARLRRNVTPVLVCLYTTLIFGLPAVVAVSPVRVAWDHKNLSVLAMALGPMIYAAAFVFVSGALSLAHQAAIVPGKFPRDVGHPIYFHRRLYGLCWTCLYYNKPVYYLALTLPILKRIAFRIFGYRGPMSFTVYPDTWIRDL